MSQSKTWDISLAEKVEQGDLAAVLQLIGGIAAAGDSAMLHLAAKQLESAVTVRVADLAANALLHKLTLKTSFAAKPAGGYTSAELAEIHNLIRSSVPR
jgi:hypothetical protein